MPQLRGISLGVTPDAHFEKREITLSPGESIFLFTDGLTEAENVDRELFGMERLVQFIKESREVPIGKGLLDEIRRWRGNAPVNDDITLLEIWRDPV
jgi:sigma-B regulation protein RsbU (phosphoserine phosphatase)